MGGDSGGGGGNSAPPANTTQTVTQNLPAYVEPYAQEAMKRASDLSQASYQPYGGQRYASMTPQNTAGLNMVQNRAMYGSPEENAARSNFTQTMNGSYMNPDSNPYLKQTVNAAMGDAASKVNSQFSGSNYGTTAHQGTLASTLGGVASQMYGANYANEREAQQRAMTLLPQYGNIDYNNAQQMAGVGDIYRQENQNNLNMQYGDWMNAQQQPYKNLDVLSSGIRGAMAGGSSSSSTASNPYQPNRTANVIGGALAGGSLASMAGGQYAPAGAAAGGLLGLWG